jgi:hypothetical protein
VAGTRTPTLVAGEEELAVATGDPPDTSLAIRASLGAISACLSSATVFHEGHGTARGFDLGFHGEDPDFSDPLRVR